MFVIENANEIINALFGDVGLILLGIGAVLLARHIAKTSIARSVCLRASCKMTEDFYNKAEKLLNDPVVPDDIKSYVLDLTEAVTDPEYSKIAIDVIIESVSRTNGTDKKLGKDSDLEKALDELRGYRSELVDTFYDSIRLAFGSILLSSNKNDPRVTITYANHNVILSLLGIIDKKFQEFASKNQNGANNHSHMFHNSVS